MAGRMGEQAVVYDITDDWTTFTQKGAHMRKTVEQDAQLCRRADAVIVCSQRLYEMKQELAKRLYLVANGVDADHYEGVLEDGPRAPALAGKSGTILGYTGTIHPDRVDVDLVEKVARHFSSGTVALVGPLLLDDADKARLQSCGNVIMTGPVPYKDIPTFMRAFDVCITPHVMTSFTESLNPIKLWEYLAAGKPIVSTNVAGFRDYDRLVHLATDADSFHRRGAGRAARRPGAARRAAGRGTATFMGAAH
jgi:glycosyltransferase involved in cell wall biosynthesis